MCKVVILIESEMVELLHLEFHLKSEIPYTFQDAKLKAENTRLQKELDDKNREAEEERQRQLAIVELKRKQDELEARTNQEMEDAIARREGGFG